MLRYPKDERRSISNLENMMIKTPNGSTIPVRQIAKLEIGEGLSSIQRKDRKRAKKCYRRCRFNGYYRE
ncbi:MAG: hypothetical protein CM15mP4_0530 [Candidatus Neomarinimicrobiota bacterium]|nr:MAG: hypothetical protein CM15mP4_0530 [Candidatus Neomarinimicrobiota bacterium]